MQIFAMYKQCETLQNFELHPRVKKLKTKFTIRRGFQTADEFLS